MAPSTLLGIDSATASLSLAFDAADYFRIPATRARAIAVETGAAVSQCRAVAKRQGLSAEECDRMSAAECHNDKGESFALSCFSTRLGRGVPGRRT